MLFEEAIKMKKSMRKNIRNVLKTLPMEYINEKSKTLCRKVVELAEFNECSSMSIYLSMSNEVNTSYLIQECFKKNKKVFVPKVIGKGYDDMKMVEILSFDQIDRFPKNSWGIPEPEFSPDFENNYANIDFVIVPGLAFDSNLFRLGHGKGYYGTLFCSIL